jgi:hypothetical protein
MEKVKRDVEKRLKRDRRKKAVGNFFKGKNVAGGIFYKLVGLGSVTAIGLDLTNIINIGGSVMDLSQIFGQLDFTNPVSIVLSVVVILLIGWQAYASRKDGGGSLPKEAKEVMQELLKARKEDSEDGAKLSEAELRRILHESADVVELILKRYGINVDLNNDNK